MSIKSALPPASGERPDFTAGPDTIPDGHLQLETGFTRSLKSNTNIFGVGGLLRYGVADNFELRANLPLYIREGAGDIEGEREEISGFTDSGVGTKWKFVEEDGDYTPGVALISGISLPTGKKEFRSKTPELNLSLELSKQLTDSLEISSNLVNTDGSFWAAATSLGYDINSWLGIYGEIYRTSPKENWFDCGFVFQIDNDTALDITYGRQFSGGGEGGDEDEEGDTGKDSYWGGGLVKRW